MKAFLFEQLAGLVSFLNTFFGKIDIGPPVKRFSLFQMLSPWRIKTTFFIFFELFVDE
jgi:hypothetical protein